MGSMLWGLPTLSSRTRRWRLLAPLTFAPGRDHRRCVCVCLPCQVEIMHMRHKLDTDTKLIRWAGGTGVHTCTHTQRCRQQKPNHHFRGWLPTGRMPGWSAGWLRCVRPDSTAGALHTNASRNCLLVFAPWLVAPVKRSLCASPPAFIDY